jgi:hypothetical protein
MRDIYAFYTRVKDRLQYLSPHELREATLLLGNLASTQPPNLPAWKDNIVGIIKFVAQAHDEFFQNEGVCALWPRGLRGGQTPNKSPQSMFSYIARPFYSRRNNPN